MANYLRFLWERGSRSRPRHRTAPGFPSHPARFSPTGEPHNVENKKSYMY